MRTDIKFSNGYLELVAFCVITGIGAALLYHGLFNNRVSTLENGAAHIYGWAWYLFLGMFGGLHSAPAWSAFPSAILAVAFENLLVYLLIKRIAGWIRRKPPNEI